MYSKDKMKLINCNTSIYCRSHFNIFCITPYHDNCKEKIKLILISIAERSAKYDSQLLSHFTNHHIIHKKKDVYNI